MYQTLVIYVELDFILLVDSTMLVLLAQMMLALHVMSILVYAQVVDLDMHIMQLPHLILVVLALMELIHLVELTFVLPVLIIAPHNSVIEQLELVEVA